MAEKDKKYYWLKLKRDFFKRHDIQIIEDMPNGKDYILFYVKLLCESVDHDGMLRFNEEIPYNEEMLATITRTNVDIVRSAVKVFSQLQMMEILDDGTIYMREVQKMLGCESYWAEQKRLQRKNGALLDNVQHLSNDCQTCPSKSIDIDKEKELEIDTEIEKEEINNNKETINTVDAVFKRMMQELEETITPITYATFFDKQLKLEGVEKDRLLLSANSFMAQVIDEKYRDKVITALKIASNGQITNIGWVWER
jgi:predicted phage replisome organizer